MSLLREYLLKELFILIKKYKLINYHKSLSYVMLTFNLIKKLMNKITKKMIATYVRSKNITAFTEAVE